MIASVAEIDQQLREEFRRHLGEYGLEAIAIDPALAILFRTLAHQLGAISGNTDALRTSLLHELLDGLHIDKRFAQPSQIIVTYRGGETVSELAAGTELIGKPEQGGRSSFLTDYAMAVSPARIAGVFIYQNEMLRLLSGMLLPDQTIEAEPEYAAVPAPGLGSFPAIYIAVENLPLSHLSRHGFFLQASRGAELLHARLARENWCFASSSGRFEASGVLRPTPLNGGQLRLRWLLRQGEESMAAGERDDAPLLPGGYWQGRCFLLPAVPSGLDLACVLPRGLEQPVRQIFRRSALFEQPRAWLRIQLDTRIEPLATSLSAVHLHAQSASNVQLLHQTIHLARHGSTVPLNPEGRSRLFLVRPLSIVGEGGSAYVPELDGGAEPGAGRYRIEGERITLFPAHQASSGADRYVNLRLWMTEGRDGNGLGAARLDSFALPPADRELRVENITVSAGGSNGEPFQAARDRFAEVLLSRQRLLTRSDIDVAVRGFDTRIEKVEITPRLIRSPRGGLDRIYALTLRVPRQRFTEGEEEARILMEELGIFLRERMPLDVEPHLELEWV